MEKEPEKLQTHHQTVSSGSCHAGEGLLLGQELESHSGGQSFQVLWPVEEPVAGRGGIPPRHKHTAGNFQSWMGVEGDTPGLQTGRRQKENISPPTNGIFKVYLFVFNYCYLFAMQSKKETERGAGGDTESYLPSTPQVSTTARLGPG